MGDTRSDVTLPAQSASPCTWHCSSEGAIATAVAQEKTSRISEVLLVVLRPSQILVGTVLAVGTVTLTQILILATPVAIAVRLPDDMGLPLIATGDIALGVAWCVIGFALYGFLYAACGALVSKVAEVSTTVMPSVRVMLAAYLASILAITEDPTSPWRHAPDCQVIIPEVGVRLSVPVEG